MTTDTESLGNDQQSVEKSLLGELLENSRTYHGSKAFKELLDFAVGMRNFAPFNAFLLHLQRPGTPSQAK